MHAKGQYVQKSGHMRAEGNGCLGNIFYGARSDSTCTTTIGVNIQNSIEQLEDALCEPGDLQGETGQVQKTLVV